MCAVFATFQHAWYAHDFACVDDLAISDTVDHLDEMPYFYWLIVLRAVRAGRPHISINLNLALNQALLKTSA